MQDQGLIGTKDHGKAAVKCTVCGRPSPSFSVHAYLCGECAIWSWFYVARCGSDPAELAREFARDSRDDQP